MSTHPATLETTEADVIASENRQLRAALGDIRNHAGLFATSTTASPATLQAALAILGRLASDALEQT